MNVARWLLPLVLLSASGCATDPEGPSAEDHKELGDMYYQRGKWDQARAEFKMAIAKDEELYEAYIALAYTLRMQGQQEFTANPNEYGRRRAAALYAEADKWANECLNRDENNPEALHLLGLLLYDSNKVQEALDQFDKVLDHDPRHIHANFYRSWCFFYLALNRRNRAQEAEAKGNTEEAEALLKEAGKKYGEAAVAMESYLTNWEKTNMERAPKEADYRNWIKVLRDMQKNRGEFTEEAKLLGSKIKGDSGLPAVRDPEKAPDDGMPEVHEK